jgi:hypothetical protein
MKTGCTARLTGVFILGISLFLLSGCGYKNAPVPPENVVPVAISDLRYKLDETGDKAVQLSWSYPVKTIRGSVLDDISAFDLYMAEIPLEDYCSTCPIPFNKPIQLDGGQPYDGEARRKAGYEYSMLQSGYKYFFKIRSRTSWWADSADSNVVTFVWFQPAAAPQEVAVKPGDGQVLLEWQPVTSFYDGSALAMPMKYQVLRSVDGSSYEKLGEPVETVEYLDRQVSNGVKYFYTIQSMMVLQDELVSGGISNEVTAIPLDMTPPAAPTGVTVVQTDVGMKIFWDRVDAADLGGYRIYRRTADSNSFDLLGEVEPVYTIFTDSTANEGIRYYYAISAIDRTTPPNESRKSKEATSRY